MSRPHTGLTGLTGLMVSVLFIALCASSCTPGGDGDGDGDRDGGGDGDGDGDAPNFDVETITLTDAEAKPLPGRGLGVATLSDGRFAVAFVQEGTGTYECQLFGGGTVEGGINRNVRVAIDDGAGGVTVTTVDTIPGAASQSVDIVADGDELILVYAGGDTANGYCGPSDFVMARGNAAGFTTTVVATDSGNASGECRLAIAGEDSYCAIGDTVGQYASVAVSADGLVVTAYQDFHNGFADKDINGTDLEVGKGAGALALQHVSTESGAGYHTDIAIGPDDRVVIGHEVISNNQFVDGDGVSYSVPKGIYVVVEQTDGTFLDTNIAAAVQTDHRIAVGHHASLGFVAAYHDRTSNDIIFWVSNDDGATWTPEPVDQLGLVGQSPALAFLSDGTPVIAYRFCANAGSENCNPSVDRVRVAIRTSSGWKKQDMPQHDEQNDGTEIAISVAPDDTVVVASHNPTRNVIIIHKLTRSGS